MHECNFYTVTQVAPTINFVQSNTVNACVLKYVSVIINCKPTRASSTVTTHPGGPWLPKSGRVKDNNQHVWVIAMV